MGVTLRILDDSGNKLDATKIDILTVFRSWASSFDTYSASLIANFSLLELTLYRYNCEIFLDSVISMTREFTNQNEWHKTYVAGVNVEPITLNY